MNASLKPDFQFNTLAAAKRFIDSASEILYIVMGDNELFWVSTPRKARAQMKAGYELVTF